MTKKLIIWAVVSIGTVVGIYLYRGPLLQQVAGYLIRQNLPPQVQVDTIFLNLATSTLTLGGVRVDEVPGSPVRYTAAIETVVCHYTIKTRLPIEGVVTGIAIEGARMHLVDAGLDLGAASASIDLRARQAALSGITVSNMPGFLYEHLFEAESVSASYTTDAVAAHGYAMLDLEIIKPTLCIERLVGGRINAYETQRVLGAAFGAQMPEHTATPSSRRDAAKPVVTPSAESATFLKPPVAIRIQQGKVIFVDHNVIGHPLFFILGQVASQISIASDQKTGKLSVVEVAGEGVFNENERGHITWKNSYYPGTPALTMSNRFEFDGIDIVPFRPYYNAYSPFLFSDGTVSGTIVVDFDNGSIGSMNELHLKNLAFSVKPGYEDAALWDASVRDLARYFTSSDEIVFDFKIKGSPSDPQGHLGPISKKALMAMAVDKASGAISGIIAEVTKATDQAKSGTPPVNEIEKIQDYYKAFKGIVEKYKTE